MRERSDVIRNRQLIVAAATRAFADATNPGSVTMADLAHGAGVGRATLYRHFDSVAAIATSLLDEHERDLQQRLLSGPPPLGPGATPAARLAAFYEAMVALLEEHSDLVLGSETGKARFDTGAYGFWRAHVRGLAREARADENESSHGVLSDILLAPLDPSLYRDLRKRGAASSDIASSLGLLADRMLG